MKTLLLSLCIILTSFCGLSAGILQIPEQHATIAEAAVAASAFDTLSLAAGVHAVDDLEVAVPISIMARDTLIYATTVDGSLSLVGSQADTCHIVGCRFANTTNPGARRIWAVGGVFDIRRNAFEGGDLASGTVMVWLEDAVLLCANNVFRNMGYAVGHTGSGVGSRIVNCIIVNCINGIHEHSRLVEVSYNCFHDVTEYNTFDTLDVGNIFLDPLIDTVTYHVDPASPCIDAGDPAYTVPPGGGTRVDIGVLESGGFGGSFAVIAPQSGTVTSTRTPLFIWHQLVDTVSLEVYDEHRFLITESVLLPDWTDTALVTGDTTYTHHTPLTEGPSYYWRVEAINDTGGLAYSPLSHFRVAHFPSGVAQAAPAPGATVGPGDWLIWFRASDNDLYDTVTYTLEFGDSAFQSVALRAEGVVDSTGSSPVARGASPPSSASDSLLAVRISSLTGHEVLLDDVSYYWRVQAVDRYGALSEWTTDAHWFYYQAGNTPPEVISEGFSPSDSEQVLSLSPHLTWYPPVDPDNAQDSLVYIVQLDDDGEFINDARYTHGTGLGQPGLFVPDSLVDHTLWSWRVQAHDALGAQSPWSATQYFWTNSFNDPPTGFALQAPVNDTIVFSLAPMLTWGASTDPDPLDSVSYLIDLAVDEDFIFKTTLGPVLIESILLTDSLALNTGYWWRVRAVDAYGKTTESDSTFAFRTFLPGDWDLSTDVTTSDIIAVINFIFRSGPAYGPIWLGDVDQSCFVTAADAIYLVGYVFKGGPAPEIGCE